VEKTFQMNLHRKLPCVPNLLAEVCLFLAVFIWLGDLVTSVGIHPWYRSRHDLFSVILSAVAAGASSKQVSILGLIGFVVFVILLIQEYLVLVGLPDY
jgi:hypothetical protein